MKRIDEKLALFGGPRAVSVEHAPYRSIGEEERVAVDKVMRSGSLSKFLGVWHEDFYGGPKVQEFERELAEYFGVKHAITVNSWTSGLVAAVGALGIEPGDEVIVSPWTMSASATAILHWNAIPVFADIEKETFNLDPESVRKCISPQTTAIMAIDIFGHSANMLALQSIADEFDLKLISDTAQAPGARIEGKYAGTLADIGGYSLNYHKHIHTGEGGVLVTDNDEYAERLQLIRNHAEVVVREKGVTNIINMVGYNFRLGEIESAIGIEQLKKLEGLVNSRQQLAERLTYGLRGIDALRPPVIKQNCEHVYYMYPLVYDKHLMGCSRERFAEAMAAEGVNLSTAYQNIHLLPMYQRKIAFGSKGVPWTADFCKREVDYSKGICPVAEELNESSYLGFGMCVYDLTHQDIDDIAAGFQKVWKQRAKLAEK